MLRRSLLEIIQALLHVDGDAFVFNCDRLELAEFKAISSRIGMQNLCIVHFFLLNLIVVGLWTQLRVGVG